MPVARDPRVVWVDPGDLCRPCRPDSKAMVEAHPKPVRLASAAEALAGMACGHRHSACPMPAALQTAGAHGVRWLADLDIEENMGRNTRAMLPFTICQVQE